MVVRDRSRENMTVPADPGCSGIPGFPYTPVIFGFIEEGLATDMQDDLRCYITHKIWTFSGRIQNISFYFAQIILFITVGLFLTITIRAPFSYSIVCGAIISY